MRKARLTTDEAMAQAAAVKAWLEREGLTVVQAAARFGVDPGTFWRWSAGLRRPSGRAGRELAAEMAGGARVGGAVSK